MRLIQQQEVSTYMAEGGLCSIHHYIKEKSETIHEYEINVIKYHERDAGSN